MLLTNLQEFFNKFARILAAVRITEC